MTFWHTLSLIEYAKLSGQIMYNQLCNNLRGQRSELSLVLAEEHCYAPSLLYSVQPLHRGVNFLEPGLCLAGVGSCCASAQSLSGAHCLKQTECWKLALASLLELFFLRLLSQTQLPVLLSCNFYFCNIDSYLNYACMCE